MSDYPYAEIGVHILADTISIFSTETDVFPLKNSEDIPNIISRYCEFIQEKVKKVGIIEKNIENRVYQANSVSIAVCKDIDAFALMNHDHLQVHTWSSTTNYFQEATSQISKTKTLPLLFLHFSICLVLEPWCFQDLTKKN